MSGVLGCAASYDVVLGWVRRMDASGDPLSEPVWIEEASLGKFAQLRWGRVLGGVSSASLELTGDQLSPCCDLLGRVQPLAWEMHVHRDGVLVWAGPVIRTPQLTGRGGATIEAADRLWWLFGDHAIHNTVNVSYRDRDVVDIAELIIRRNMQTPYVDPQDSMLIASTMLTRPGDLLADYAPGLDVVPVGSMLDDLAEVGLAYSCVAGSVTLCSVDVEATVPNAVLRGPDFVGDVEVSDEADPVATVGVAVRPGPDADSPPTLFVSARPNAYGTRMAVVDMDAEASNSAAGRAASAARRGRSFPPTVVSGLAGAVLSPKAPVTVDELAPGWSRVDLELGDVCPPVYAPGVITEVEAVWTGGAEEIAVSTASVDATQLIAGEG